MKFDPFLSDEPSIAPPTPGAVIVRLSQVLGILSAASQEAAPNASTVPNFTEKLASARGALLQAIECGQNLGTTFNQAQNTLREFYKNITQTNEDEEARSELLMRFGFPDPRLIDAESPVSPVKVSSVVATHFKPQRQVFTTLSFDEAHGATAYWLLEVRYLGEERFVDGVVENYAPQFSRVRLPVGTHRLIIESRNSHRASQTEEFSLEVPAL
ncbi:hypothetical protein B1R32_10448 [Abditibacterium utsteinense]|uniref:Uncharacterized protein n=1 Tax=Abditibacterium utsteinense TaxID=1960156 RepID=A0A2S8SUT5_9BACT|nr:hypothetical protein [Abditibacterium utsteinense]PQV64555.1 hypothetical protein B1R32_10448 [Abditibacterium utsteinense]